MSVDLVTGADGFVGQHLVAALLEQGHDVVGAVRRTPPELTTLSAAQAERVRWATFELEDAESVRRLVREHPADRVFHLAAVTSVARSLQTPVTAFNVNVVGTLYLLEELARNRDRTERPAAVLITGSAQVYGSAAARYRPLNEECPLEPLSPYAVSKAAQELLGLQFHRAHGLPVVATRSFNHTGPGQRPPFVAPQLALQIQRLRASDGGVVRVGDLDVRRDFTDVRDVVRAYVLLAGAHAPGRVFNVCSGRSVRIGDLLDILADLAGVEVRVEADPERQRPAEVLELVGSYGRLGDRTGWEPRIELRRTLGDLLASLDGDSD